ncbi:hypothetical protein V8F20_006870 [Naviculisporaceae sp. PSN 640]
MGSTGHLYPDSSNGETGTFQPVAVCGIGVRLPGGIRSPEQFWEFLMEKKSARSRVPSSRFDVDGHYSPHESDGLMVTDQGYFLDEHPGELDTSFFSFTKAELEYIDPHQRHLLEVVYECFESAGEANYRGSNIGCYVGSFSDDWFETLFHDLQMYGKYPAIIGGDYSVPSRISFEYDLRGPSMSLRTACSSTLVALSEACSAMARGECDGAIVAGCQFLLCPSMSIIMGTRGMLSPDGICKTFDAAANGYGRGEAINAVYLKPLSAALRDRNPIRAIIRGSTVNADGKSSGFSVPSTESQEFLIRRAHQMAGISDCRQTPYVECHGTGTSVGDPIEASTIARVYGGQEVFIGSVKPNLGHSEGASGLTSLIKAILAVEKGIIPPNINFQNPNPKIPFSKGGLTVPTEAVPWPSDRPLRAGINSFGLGGVNAHASRSRLSGPVLLPFSANTPESVAKIIKNHHAYLEQDPGRLHDLSYTLGARRSHLPLRGYSVVSQDGNILRTSSNHQAPAADHRPEIVMVFTGQGAQWPGMGAELYQTNRTFRDSLDNADQTLRDLPDAPSWSIVDEISKSPSESNLSQALYSQPICTAVQIALVDALGELNIKPFAVIGHSSGELAAAYAGGRLTAREAMICAYYRGLVSGQVKGCGAMAAVGMGREDATQFLRPGVVIACENSPVSVTISGNLDAIDECLSAIQAQRPDVLARKLKVDTAYHSSHMAAVGSRYQSLLEGFLTPSVSSSVLFVSAVSGGLVSNSELLDADYWKRNLECPVLFRQGIEAILDDFRRPLFFLEVGPHSALAGPLRQIFDSKSVTHPYGSCLNRSMPCSESFISLLGQLYVQNQPLDWDKITDPNRSAQVLADAPTYSWHHTLSKVYEPRSIREWKHPSARRHELLGQRTEYSTDDQPTWRNVLFFKHVPWVHEHQVAGAAVFPAAGYVSMAIEAVRQVADPGAGPGYHIKSLEMRAAMVLDRYNTTEIITSLWRRGGQWYDFSISSYNGTSWVEHCSGAIRRGASLPPPVKPNGETKRAEDLPRSIVLPRWYQALAKKGVDYGTSFQGVRTLRSSTSRCYASAEVISTVKNSARNYAIHPTRLDACFQTVYAAAFQGLEWKIGQLPVPTRFGDFHILDCNSDTITCNVSAELLADGAISSRLEAYSSDGTMVIYSDDTVCKPAGLQTTANNEKGTGARLHWANSFDFVALSSLVSTRAGQEEDAQILAALTEACVEESLARLEQQRVSTIIPHLQNYNHWLMRQRQSPGKDKLRPLWKDITKQSMSASIAPCAAAMIKVVDNIVPLFKGEVDPVELLMTDDSLLKMYDYLNLVDRSSLWKALGHHHPSQRILEIGAGTGGTTANILRHTSYSSYTFTDVSAGFFPAAKARFKDHPDMVFKTLDITKDPLSQGFQPESFDLILASNVLHATPSLHETLVNVRKLLHPSGKLLMEELCGDIKYSNIAVGILSGWWAGEGDGRRDEPYVSPSRWEAELRAAGFNGLDGLAFDAPHPIQSMAYMLASPKKLGIPTTPTKAAVALVTDSSSFEVALLVQKHLLSRGHDLVIRDLGDPLPASSDVMVIVDTVKPFFHEISADELSNFQRFLRELQQSHSGALWVTRSCQVGCSDPRYSLTIGAVRTCRTEFGLDFATCEVDTTDYNAMSLAVDVFEQFRRRDHVGGTPLREMEYVIQREAVLVGRLIPFSMQDEIHTSDLQSATLRSDAAYLLVGGLGGLGCGLAQWLAEKNARHLVFLSRNAGTAEAHKQLFLELEGKGCTSTAIQGDISNLADVRKAIAMSPAPLKGIFNLSMILRDASFLTMNIANWQAATDPKVKGTWNLHRASREMDLDFFVLFSSLCGIVGMPGQANYAAANTFMDAFVHYRHQQNLSASVIDVGAVDGIGWTAENPNVLERSRWLNSAVLSQRDLFQATTLAVFAYHNQHQSRKVESDEISLRHEVVFSERSQITSAFQPRPALREAFQGNASFLDRRLIAYANQGAVDAAANPDNGKEGIGAALRSFVSGLNAGNFQDKLDDPATSEFIATEVALWVFDLLLKPVEDEADVDLARSFVDIGFDSLAAVELRTWWKAVLGLDISVLEIMSFANLAGIGDFAVQGLRAKFKP